MSHHIGRPPEPPSTHQPYRPSWRCAACHEEWPCRRRRDELIVECGGSRVALALYMARYFSDAVDDHPATPASVLYVRFLGWFGSRRR